MAGINGDGDGAVGGHGNSKGVLIPFGQVHKPLVSGAHITCLEGAVVLMGEVRVALLGVDALFVVDKLRREVNEKSSVAGKR